MFPIFLALCILPLVRVDGEETTVGYQEGGYDDLFDKLENVDVIVKEMSSLVEKVEIKMDKVLSKMDRLDLRIDILDSKLTKLEELFTNNSGVDEIISPMKSLKDSSMLVAAGLSDEFNMTVIDRAVMAWAAAYQGNKEWKKIFSHDTAGGLFANLEDAKNKNPQNENSKLFSILDQLEKFRDAEGNFELKVCYPEVTYTPIYPCNEWIQSSNPVHETNITGFRALRIAFPKTSTGGTFSGLGLSPPSFGSTLIDETPSHGNWYFAIGALQYWHKDDTIPGPRHGDTDLAAVRRVELWVKTSESEI